MTHTTRHTSGRVRFSCAVAFLGMAWSALAPCASSVAAQSDVTKLLQERLAVLEQIVTVRTEAFELGRAELKPVTDAQRDVANAKLELATTQAERIAAIEELLAAAKRMEDAAKARYEAGVAPLVDMLAAKANRLRAEADLAKERKRK